MRTVLFKYLPLVGTLTPGWYTVSVSQVVNNTYINPNYKGLMKFVPGTFCWLMYLSPFTLPPTFSRNQLCYSCLHRYSACPSPQSHGHVFMSKALLHCLLRILPHNITLSEDNKYNNFTSLLYKQIGLIPTFTV